MGTYVTISLIYGTLVTIFLWAWCLLISGGRIKEDLLILLAFSAGIMVIAFLWPLLPFAILAALAVAFIGEARGET